MNWATPGQYTVAERVTFKDGGHRRSRNREPKRIRERQFDRLPIKVVFMARFGTSEPS
jgi:hypothetical protein